MGRKRHTPEQIITALREAEVGLATCDSAASMTAWGAAPGRECRRRHVGLPKRRRPQGMRSEAMGEPTG